MPGKVQPVQAQLAVDAGYLDPATLDQAAEVDAVGVGVTPEDAYEQALVTSRSEG